MIHILFHSHAVFCWRANDYLCCWSSTWLLVMVQRVYLNPWRALGRESCLISSLSNKQNHLFGKEGMQVAGFLLSFCGKSCVSVVSSSRNSLIIRVNSSCSLQTRCKLWSFYFGGKFTVVEPIRLSRKQWAHTGCIKRRWYFHGISVVNLTLC